MSDMRHRSGQAKIVKLGFTLALRWLYYPLTPLDDFLYSGSMGLCHIRRDHSQHFSFPTSSNLSLDLCLLLVRLLGPKINVLLVLCSVLTS